VATKQHDKAIHLTATQNSFWLEQKFSQEKQYFKHDAGFGHPDQQCGARQRQRQAGGKAEQQHDQHAALQIHRKPLAPRRARFRQQRDIGRAVHVAVLADSRGLVPRTQRSA